MYYILLHCLIFLDYVEKYRIYIICTFELSVLNVLCGACLSFTVNGE